MLAKASVLFWRKGYQGTSMRDIAKAYGCKPANIYNFFPNKEYLLFEILRDQMQRLISIIKPLENDQITSPYEQLRFIIRNHLTHTLSYKKSYKLLFDLGLDNLSPAKRKNIVSLRDEYDRILQRIIGRGVAQGNFCKIDEKLASYNIASMVARTIIWYSPTGRLSVAEIIDSLVKFALYGLAGGEPIKEGAGKRANKS